MFERQCRSFSQNSSIGFQKSCRMSPVLLQRRKRGSTREKVVVPGEDLKIEQRSGVIYMYVADGWH